MKRKNLMLLVAMTALANAQEFAKTKLINDRGQEVPVSLDFNAGKQFLTVKSQMISIAEIPYNKIEKLNYELSSQHRIKQGAVVMIASFGAGAIVMATKSKKHWLYVDYIDTISAQQHMVLKLDKTEFQKVLATADAQKLMRSGSPTPVRKEASVKALSPISGNQFTPKSTDGEEPAKQSEVAAGVARVYVYRASAFTGSALAPSVFCDGKELARLENGRYFVATLPPGKHQFETNDAGKSAVRIEVKSGEEYFVHLTLAAGMMKGHGRLTEVTKAQGIQDMRRLQSLDPDRIRDQKLAGSGPRPTE